MMVWKIKGNDLNGNGDIIERLVIAYTYNGAVLVGQNKFNIDTIICDCIGHKDTIREIKEKGLLEKFLKEFYKKQLTQ